MDHRRRQFSRMMKIEIAFPEYRCLVNRKGRRRLTKDVAVPTRPRSKRNYELKLKNQSYFSFIEKLGLSPEQLQEKIRKINYSRDYKFLFSEDAESHQIEYKSNVDVKLYSAMTKALNFGLQSRRQEQFHNIIKARPQPLFAASQLANYSKKADLGNPRALRKFVVHDDDEEEDEGLRLKSLKRKRGSHDSDPKRSRKIQV